MKKTFTLGLGVMLVVTLCWSVTVFHLEAEAKAAVAVEGAKFDTSLSLADNLKIYVGKDVIVHLRSGKSFQGYVKSVGNGLVHLEKLSGRDFYDALIRVEDISALEAKFRDMK